ncbi:ComF family protein [Vulcaniibacterium tengchongense]|uniref:ComF family protein n=2 Tax=Vulcaniibacterium tengchongense TaxID=1273429 RepID=A0A3N4W464_9GAMM|nr:ComF family protein [Vulcaniibacterium tengchongense]RPE80004.1 ComF family protein [Vulcaniibacterium tengchongense]
MAAPVNQTSSFQVDKAATAPAPAPEAAAPQSGSQVPGAGTGPATSPRPRANHPALRRWLDRIGLALWPPRCLLCAEPGEAGRDLCRACHAALPFAGPACVRCALPLPAPAELCGACLRRPPPQASAHAAFVYAFPLDRLLPRAKFHGDLAGARLLAQLMAPRFAAAERPQALLPVPLHRSRLRRRGYDQALELARPLARALELPLRDDLLRRVRATAAQSRLDAAARRRNLRGAFAVRAGVPLPAHVAVFDDVMTTGATVHAAARALRRAGVARVDVWVCARAP